MKKILFGITSLRPGGAERVLIDIANKLCSQYDVSIFTLYGNGEFENQLNSKIKLITMNNNRYDNLSRFDKVNISFNLINAYTRKKIYNRYINNDYDVIISFLEGPITWIFSEGKNVRKIAWIHNDIVDVFGSGKKAILKKRLNEKAYLDYDKIIFVSNDNLDRFKLYYPMNNVSKEVVYNYLDRNLVIKKSKDGSAKEFDNSSISFLQVSRLVSQKAIDRLIDVHKKLIDDGLEHKIYVIGDGPLKDSLSKKVLDLKLDKTFILLGQRENPYPYIKNCDYFVLASYYEGLGMVLLEAKLLNKYILITDTAARETLVDYNNKLIMENSDVGIYNGLKEIIMNKPKSVNQKKDYNDDLIKKIINIIEGD